MKMRWITLLLALLVAAPVFAHGDKVHVMGIIEKLTPQTITVKNKEGKSIEVKIAATTAYMDSAEKPAKFADLAVGQRVVIHADPKGTDLIAATVKFSNAAATAAATPK
jgi:Domain of unknown function (DUF5666)